MTCSAPPSRQPTPGLTQLFECAAWASRDQDAPLISREPTPGVTTSFESMLAVPGAGEEEEEAWEALLSHVRASRRGGRQAVYVPPGKDAADAFERQLAAYVDALGTRGRGTRAPPAGFYEAMATGEVVLLREMVRTGGPAMILRTGHHQHPGGGCTILLEAPHTFFDAQTMPIALALFQRLPPTVTRAFMWNTVHRGNASDPTHRDAAVARSGDLPSDVAHSPDSYFQRAHEVLIAAGPRPEKELLTIQIHGFRTDLVPEADLVLAAADTHVRDMAKLQRALAQRLPALRVIESPQQTPLLTGMRNVQAAACRASSQPRPFLHCEFSHAWRRKFVEDAKLLGLLVDAFADVWGC